MCQLHIHDAKICNKDLHTYICTSTCTFTFVIAAKVRCSIVCHGWGTGRTWMIRNGPQGNGSEKEEVSFVICEHNLQDELRDA